MLRRSLSPDRHPSVHRHRSQPGTTGAQGRFDVPATDRALPGDGEIGVNGTVGGACYELRRVVRRQCHANAAVLCFDIETSTIPLVACEIDLKAPVGGLSSYVAVDVGKHYATIVSAEL